MTVASTGNIDELRAQFSGKIIQPGDGEYDESRSLWNGQCDQRPALIARCANTSDVAATVKYARANSIEFTIRGGGHNYSGNACKDGMLMIHLGDMKDVSVDADAKRVKCGGGATWGDVDAATQEHGLACPGGFISHTGVAGLSLGGGVGWLTKLGGLSCDNLTGAEVVTASGEVVKANADDNSDLFWALRGGGGNFGVVTEFEFKLYPVGPMVNMGLLFWALDQGEAALKLIRDVIPGLPADATAFIGAGLSAPPAPFVPEEHHFAPGYALVVVGFDTPEKHGDLLAPIREKVPPLFEFVTPIPFAQLQQMFNESAPWGLFGYEKALFLSELSDDVIAVILEESPKKGSPLSFVPMFPMYGAFGLMGEDETAFGGPRSAKFVMNIAGHTPEPAGFEAEREWVRNYWAAMQPLAMGSGGYINFQVEPDPDRVRATYGPEKYDRLAKIKAQYDPDNVFHFNANIAPAK